MKFTEFFLLLKIWIFDSIDMLSKRFLRLFAKVWFFEALNVWRNSKDEWPKKRVENEYEVFSIISSCPRDANDAEFETFVTIFDFWIYLSAIGTFLWKIPICWMRIGILLIKTIAIAITY